MAKETCRAFRTPRGSPMHLMQLKNEKRCHGDTFFHLELGLDRA